MKSIFFVLALLVSQITFAQLKVDKYGRIGMGTNYPNSEFKCHIKGNLLLTNYPSTPAVEMRMKVDQDDRATLGVSTGNLFIWGDNNGFNTVYAKKFVSMSDCTTKESITPLDSSLNIIRQLNAYSYYFIKDVKDSTLKKNENKTVKEKKSIGFLAQEVENFLPEAVDTAMGYKMIDYSAIIPILAEAIKEQQTQIETLQSIVH